MNKDRLNKAVDAAVTKTDALAIVACVHDNNQGVLVDLAVTGVSSGAYVLFAAEAMMVQARQFLPIEQKCRLDYLRKEMMRIVESDPSVEFVPREQAGRTALN